MTASMTRWRSESVKGVLGRVPQAELLGPDVDFPEANQSEVAADVAVPTIVAHEQTRKTATEMSLKVRLLAESCNSTSRKLLSPPAFAKTGAGQGSRSPSFFLAVRNLQFWIDNNILLGLKDAPFDKKDSQLVPAAGNCVD